MALIREETIKMNFLRFCFVYSLIASLIGCSQSVDTPNQNPINPTQKALELIANGAYVIDVRSSEEFLSGHLSQAINIPHDQIAQRISEIKSPKDGEIVLYCKSGRRAGIAKEILESKGFSKVVNAGGYSDLVAIK